MMTLFRKIGIQLVFPFKNHCSDLIWLPVLQINAHSDLLFFLPTNFMKMDNHVQVCHSKNKSNGIHINDKNEDVAGISNPASWKSGHKCPLGCQGQWHNPESLDAHKRDNCHDHLEYLNKRVERLEKLNESRMNKENVLMVGLQQQPFGAKNDSKMEDMEKIRTGMSQEMNQKQTEFLHQHSANGAVVNTFLLSAGAS